MAEFVLISLMLILSSEDQLAGQDRSASDAASPKTTSPAPKTLATYDFTGVFTDSGISFPVGGAMAWGDYDNDGYLDLVVAGHLAGAPTVSLYRNNGGTAFTAVATGITPVWAAAVAWADYDCDGDLDLAVAGHTNSGPRCDVYRNDNGTFVNINTGLAGAGAAAIAWGDYDNDGLLDLAVAGSNQTRLYLNFPGVGFLPDPLRPDGVQFGSVGWADVDRDGWLDLAVVGEYHTGRSTTGVAKILRTSSEGFTDIAAGLTPVSFAAMDWADYDNDRDMDLAVAGFSDAGPVTNIYRNNNDGTFTQLPSSLLGLGAAALAWGDFDNDGAADLAVTGYFYDTQEQCATRIYHNDGNDTFTDIGATLVGVQYGSIAWGDYDNDGRLDLAISGRTCDHQFITRIYHNNTPTPNTPPSPPTNLLAIIAGEQISFSWDAGSDAETPAAGLTYQLRVGSQPDADNIICAMADLNTGKRRLPALGGLQRRAVTIRQAFAPPYYWSVQSIDAARAGSAWAPEQSVVFARIFNRTRGTRHDTIQSAIDAAEPGDEIVLAPSVYRGEGNRDLTFPPYGPGGLPRNLTIVGMDRSNSAVVATTVIDCEGSAVDPHRAMQIGSGQDESTVIAGLTIRNGYAPADGNLQGGGIRIAGAWPIIEYCVFRNCHADAAGGAIAVVSSAYALIHHCTLIGNTGNSGGGVAFVNALAEVSHSRMADNTAVMGGAVYFDTGNESGPHLPNCVLDGNQATYGGAVYGQAAASVELRQMTIVNNVAGTGGGIYWASTGFTRVVNSILWNNRDSSGITGPAQATAAGALYPDYCCVQNWTRTDNIPVITADPLFVNLAGPDHDAATWIDNDYHLDRMSPCVNVGDPARNYDDEEDIEGTRRRYNCYVDLGAYESPWPRPRVNFNDDCFVDAIDLTHMEACATGAYVLQDDPDCIDADVDLDGDVDIEDFAILQRCWTDTSVFVDPRCK